MAHDDGGQAFPIPLAPGLDGSLNAGEPGMTLRDYFAGQALAGLLSQTGAEFRLHTPEGILIVPAREAAPVLAYAYADAMLAEHKKVPTP